MTPARYRPADANTHHRPTRLVAARNLFFGKPAKFKLWNDSDTKKAFVKAAGWIEIDFPEQDDNVVESTFGA